MGYVLLFKLFSFPLFSPLQRGNAYLRRPRRKTGAHKGRPYNAPTLPVSPTPDCRESRHGAYSHEGGSQPLTKGGVATRFIQVQN